MLRWLFQSLVTIILMVQTSGSVSFAQRNPFSSPLPSPQSSSLPSAEDIPNTHQSVVPSLQGLVEVEGYPHALFLLEGKKYFVTQGGLIGSFIVLSIEASKVILKNQKTLEMIPIVIQ